MLHFPLGKIFGRARVHAKNFGVSATKDISVSTDTKNEYFWFKWIFPPKISNHPCTMRAFWTSLL
jgi:hypothetical protein